MHGLYLCLQYLMKFEQNKNQELRFIKLRDWIMSFIFAMTHQEKNPSCPSAFIVSGRVCNVYLNVSIASLKLMLS